MQNKLKILSLAIAGIVIAGCNDKSETSPLAETESSKVESSTEVVKETIPAVNEDVKTEIVSATPVSASTEFVAVEGKHYELLEESITVDAFDGITLTEFFWFGCPHCQNLEPAVQGIKDTIGQDQNIKVVKSAVPGSQRWNLDTAVFHTLKELGGTESQVSLMLKHYEKERLQHNDFPSIDRIGEIFEEMGFNKEKAMQILNNEPFMKAKIEESNAEYQKLKAGGVPVLVVNGKYRILFDEVKSQEDMINIVRSLGEK